MLASDIVGGFWNIGGVAIIGPADRTFHIGFEVQSFTAFTAKDNDSRVFVVAIGGGNVGTEIRLWELTDVGGRIIHLIHAAGIDGYVSQVVLIHLDNGWVDIIAHLFEGIDNRGALTRVPRARTGATINGGGTPSAE